MIQSRMSFCGSNHDLDPGDEASSIRGLLEDEDVLLKRKKKAPPWLKVSLAQGWLPHVLSIFDSLATSQ